MDFKKLNKIRLFFIFFSAFLVIGFIPFVFVKYHTLKKVEDEMRSSLNETYYFLTEKMVTMIDHEYILHWLLKLTTLEGFLEHAAIYEQSGYNALINTFFQNEEEMVTLSISLPNQEQPLHFIKSERIRELVPHDPELVSSFFFSAGSQGKGQKKKSGRTISSPLIFKKGLGIFLPVDSLVIRNDGRLVRLRCIYELTSLFMRMEKDLSLGSRELYLVDQTLDVIFSTGGKRLFQEEKFDFPITEQINNSFKGRSEFFQLDIFTYKGISYVGNLSKTEHIDWAVVVVEPYDKAYAVVHETTKQIFLGAIAAVFLCVICALCFSWFFSLFIVKAKHALFRGKEAAEAANVAKSEFLANMSHEIRTPLNAVIGFSDLLSSMIKDADQRSYLDNIQTAGKNLLTLINDILDLSKIEAGRLDIRQEVVDVKIMLEEIRQIFSMKAAPNNIELVMEIDSTIPSFIIDGHRIRQILMNLVDNAVKFTHEGRITVSVSISRLPEDSENGDIKFTVEDTGIGIPPDQIDAVFKSFQQQDGQNTRKYGGTGLGLTISKRLTELMGGRISARSHMGKGSIFEVVLPHVPFVYDNPGKTFWESGENLHTPHFISGRVLVADDAASNRELMKAWLSQWGLEVIDADNGRQACVLARKSLPDVILMDIRMPVMNGFEAAKRIKSEEKTREIPIIALTADITSFETVHKLSSLFAAYLPKPVNVQTLFMELERYFDRDETALEEQPLEDTEGYDGIYQYDGDTGELLVALKEELMPAWQNLQGAIDIDEVETFAEQIENINGKYNIPELSTYSKSIKEQTSRLDIAGLQVTLGKYPGIVKALDNRKSVNEEDK